MVQKVGYMNIGRELKARGFSVEYLLEIGKHKQN